MKPVQNLKQLYFWVYFLTVIAVTCVFTSCQCIPKPPQPPDYRISTVQGPQFILSGGLLSSLTYDNMGRLAMFSTGTRIYSFSYSANYAILNVYSSNNTLISGGVIDQLNQQGYISRDVGLIYTYDADGHLVRQDYTIAPTMYTSYTYNTGNLIKVQTYKNGVPVTGDFYNATYTYTNKKDLRIDGLDWLWGKRSTNLPDTKTDNRGVTKSYTYVFDNWGRVKEANFDGKTTTYTYFN